MSGDIRDAQEVEDGEGRSGLAWKAALRTFLQTHRNAPPGLFGDLLDKIGPLIPRLDAERNWNAHARYGDASMVALSRKVQALFVRELARYPLEIVGREGRRGHAWKRDMRLRAITRNCPYCNVQFVGYAQAKTCSRECGQLQSAKSASRTQSPQEKEEMTVTIVANSKMHPTLTAIDAVYQALRDLPDGKTRDFVVNSAMRLVEADDPQPSLRISEFHNAAD